MKQRKVERIIAPPGHHWVGDGFRVNNFIPNVPGLSMERMNPFILLDYNTPHEFPPSNTPKGVGVHPHRGFETVTFAYKGKVQHHDSTGGGGIIGEGDVQWMTAAGGILHKEYHETEWSKQGGVFHMVQLWVNLPTKNKMDKPGYQPIVNADMSRYKIDEEGSEIEIVAGEYKGVKSDTHTYSPMHVYNAKLKEGAEAEFAFPDGYSTALLVIEGSIEVNGSHKVPTDHFVLMERQGENFTIKAESDAVILVLGGEPLNEPIAAYGPFVMNTQKELIQAFDDFQAGKFGFLED